MSEMKKKILSLTDDERAILYQRLFNTDDGKLVLEDLKIRCYDDKPSFKEFDTTHQPWDTFFNDGKRAVICHIKTQLEYRPEDKPTQQEEVND